VVKERRTSSLCGALIVTRVFYSGEITRNYKSQDALVRITIGSALFTYFTALMQPPQKEEPRMDLSVDFEQVPLFPAQEELPRQMAIAENSRKSV
jgi:hypothetical protein